MKSTVVSDTLSRAHSQIYRRKELIMKMREKSSQIGGVVEDRVWAISKAALREYNRCVDATGDADQRNSDMEKYIVMMVKALKNKY